MTSPLPDNARAFLEPALLHGGEHEWAEVERRILSDVAQLWLGDGCALATELFGDRIHVWLGGGNIKGLLTLRPLVEETARFWGCKRATIKGRPGWERLFQPYGYTRNGDELEKTL